MQSLERISEMVVVELRIRVVLNELPERDHEPVLTVGAGRNARGRGRDLGILRQQMQGDRKLARERFRSLWRCPDLGDQSAARQMGDRVVRGMEHVQARGVETEPVSEPSSGQHRPRRVRRDALPFAHTPRMQHHVERRSRRSPIRGGTIWSREHRHRYQPSTPQPPQHPQPNPARTPPPQIPHDHPTQNHPPNLQIPHHQNSSSAYPHRGTASGRCFSAGVRWSLDGSRESLSTVVSVARCAAWLATNGCALGVVKSRRVSLDRRLDALAVPAYARRSGNGGGGAG